MRHLGVEKLLSQHICAVALVSGQPLVIETGMGMRVTKQTRQQLSRLLTKKTM